MQRRSFLTFAVGAATGTVYSLPLPAFADMSAASLPVQPVRAGQDRLEEIHNFGISTIRFKVLPEESNGNMLMLEHSNNATGGPPRHVHPHQDEWFYALEGEFVIEIRGVRHTLHSGDSILAPRSVPHVWAFNGDGKGKLLVGFTPAGKMEAFFRTVGKTNAMPRQDAALFREHDMELLGPPLAL